MKITKKELDSFGLYDSLPKLLKELASGDSYVFYYSVDEANIKLKIYEERVVREINISLYRGLDEKISKYDDSNIKVGYFKNSFETKDGIFFQLLRTYNEQDKVNELYKFAMDQDRVIELNVSTDSSNEIFNAGDFSRAISYFSPANLQAIMFVYDMVDHVFRQKMSRTLYGQTIKKVVNMVKFDGGILPDMADSRMRYMVIGEKAELSAAQKERLEEAKMLIRSGHSVDKIYSKTGWALGDRDGKWRTNIADDKAAILDTFLVDYNGRKLYKPANTNIEDILPLLLNPQDLYGRRYNGILSDVLYHPTLFKYYPFLATLPLLYYYGDRKERNEPFYFSENEKGGFILINGSKSAGDSLSILLHEIEHCIQHKENYATGGNLFLAQFVASVGSASVRQIFASINKMQHQFHDKLLNDSSRLDIIRVLKGMLLNSNESRQLRETIYNLLKDYDTFLNSYKEINFLLLLLIVEEGDFTNDIVLFFEQKIGDMVFQLFDNITTGYESAKRYKEGLIAQGFTQGQTDAQGNTIKLGDIDIILFRGYENLYGELESRSVQSSRFLQSEYKNYFSLSRWEMGLINEQYTVIDGVEEVLETKNIQAACEDKNDEYVLHFNVSDTATPIIHELGHIVFDALIKMGYADRIIAEFDKQFSFNDVDEYFVNFFVAYLKYHVDIEEMKNIGLYKTNEVYNEILDEFFADVEVDERLGFLQTMLMGESNASLMKGLEVLETMVKKNDVTLKKILKKVKVELAPESVPEPEAPAKPITEAQKILQQCKIEGNVVKLPDIKLPRPLYMEVNKLLEGIGGKWTGGKVAGFVFKTDPTDLLAEQAGGAKRNLKKEFQFFATPRQLADELVIEANIDPSMKILEPSAGAGGILSAILYFSPTAKVDVCELNPQNVEILNAEFSNHINFVGTDFLELDVKNKYDRIVANPPFNKNQDIDHIYKMWEVLKKGGRIVTCSSQHFRTSSNKKEVAFRKFLDDNEATVIEIDRGRFKESGTMIGALIIILNKPK